MTQESALPQHVGCVRIRIEGRVQGVGFRVYVQRAAQRLGVSGYVRNRRDGGVEAVLSGTTEAIAAVVAACRQGPHGSVVSYCDVRDEPIHSVEGFTVSATV